MPYTTLSEVKSYLGLGSGTTHDFILAAANTYAHELADEMTGRVFGSSLGTGFDTHSNSAEVHFLRNPQEGVFLNEWPVQSVQTVDDDDTVLGSDEFELVPREPGWLQFIDDSSSSLPELRAGRIEVTYVAGFTSVPQPVKEFSFRVVDFLFNRQLDEGLSSNLISDSQRTWQSGSQIQKIFDETVRPYTLDVMS